MMTDVTIRGINDEVYNEFSAEARRQNKSIGDLTTEAMRLHLQGLHPAKTKYHFISNAKELRISKPDLDAFGRPVYLSNIERLIFEDDADLETLEKYSVRITNCKYVEFPKRFPILSAYEKCWNCAQITRRE